MSDEPKEKAAFSLEDIKALRYLAIMLGIVVGGIALVNQAGEAQLLALGLAGAMMVLGPLAIYFLRRHKPGKK